MPTYNGRCAQHGEFEDLMKISHYIEQDGLFCPECGEKAATIISAVPVIGAMPSKPIVIDQIGQTFTSEAEKRAYFAKRPDRTLVDPNDSAFINHKDLARERAEKKAKQMGFRDVEDRRTRKKRELKRRREISNGDKKISVVTAS